MYVVIWLNPLPPQPSTWFMDSSQFFFFSRQETRSNTSVKQTMTFLRRVDLNNIEKSIENIEKKAADDTTRTY